MTYNMMLNLLRVEHMQIEDMLRRSYVEKASLQKVLIREIQLQKVCFYEQINTVCGYIIKVNENIAALPSVECAFCFPQSDNNDKENNIPTLMKYFHELLNYKNELNKTWKMLVARSKEGKLFVPGRVIVIHHDSLGIIGRLAVVLNVKFNISMLNLNYQTSITDSGEFRMTLFMPISDKEKLFKKALTQVKKQ